MKLYGYSESARQAESVVPEPLAELSLVATVGELRLLAGFLSECANEMERREVAFDHVHLSDRIKAFRSSPQFIVASDRYL